MKRGYKSQEEMCGDEKEKRKYRARSKDTAQGEGARTQAPRPGTRRGQNGASRG